MPILRAMRLFNAIEANDFTAATLEALLADQGRRNDLDAVTADRALMRRLAETPVASAVLLGSARGRNSVFASTVAMEAFCGSRLGRAVVFDTPAVMAALAASAVGMATVGESVICKMQLSASATALAAVLASATALSTLRAASQYSVTQLTAPGSSSPVPLVLPGERYIALGISTSGSLNVTATLTTLTASGTGANTIDLKSSDGAGTAATNKSAAMGLQVPFTVARSQNYAMYLGLLRCDI